MTSAFDLHALFEAIDAERASQNLSWSALSRQVGVAASTMRRFDLAHDAEADGVLALVRWLGSTPEAFIPNTDVSGIRLPAGSGVVRVDMELVARANGGSQGTQGRTRTTIQRLVHVATSSQSPVASLTRLTDA